jgi:hypothetical protein
LSTPLYQLKKGNIWQWTSEMQQNFEELKCLLGNAVLQIADPQEDLVLRTDASANCIAAYLENSRGQPISFASRILTETERRYDIVEKEALAIY